MFKLKKFLGLEIILYEPVRFIDTAALETHLVFLVRKFINGIDPATQYGHY